MQRLTGNDRMGWTPTKAFDLGWATSRSVLYRLIYSLMLSSVIDEGKQTVVRESGCIIVNVKQTNAWSSTHQPFFVTRTFTDMTNSMVTHPPRRTVLQSELA